ncbi:MAG: hypothetical protein IPN11_15455 [Opitutaceae bacterium]|nr:hypothetical protein [Opitutaceae bacterium]
MNHPSPYVSGPCRFKSRSLAILMLRVIMAMGLSITAKAQITPTYRTWTSLPGGVWENFINWDGGGYYTLPVLGDSIRFYLPAAYTVTVFDQNPELDSMRVEAGDVRIKFLDNPLSTKEQIFTADLMVYGDAVFRIDSGKLFFLSGVDLGFNSKVYLEGGTISAGGGGIDTSAGVLIEGHGELFASHIGDSDLEDTTVRITGGNLNLGNPDGAYFTIYGDLEVGPHVARIINGQQSDPLFVLLPIELRGDVTLAGGELIVHEDTKITGDVMGYGLIRATDGSKLTAPSYLPLGSFAPSGFLNVGMDGIVIVSDALTNLSSGGQIAGGELYATSGLSFSSDHPFTGFGLLRGPFGSLDGLVPQGDYALSRNLSVGGTEYLLLGASPVVVNSYVTLSGGSVRTFNGLSIAAGAFISGYGTIDSALTGTGSLSTTDPVSGRSDLTVGNASLTEAINFGGTISVGLGDFSGGNIPHTLTLLDADFSRLSGTVNLFGGRLIAPNGLTMDGTLTGRGQYRGPADWQWFHHTL